MSDIPRSANLIRDLLNDNPCLLEEAKKHPEVLNNLAARVTKDMQPPPLARDVGIYYIVVLALGIVSVAAIIGAIVLSVISAQIPDTMTALGAAAIGALAGLLAPSPTSKSA